MLFRHISFFLGGGGTRRKYLTFHNAQADELPHFRNSSVNMVTLLISMDIRDCEFESHLFQLCNAAVYLIFSPGLEIFI